MGISCPGSFGKDFFDMLKSIEFGDLVRIFFQFEMIYQGLAWFVWDSVGMLFRIQPSRRQVKICWGSAPIHSSLITGFQVYHCKCWDPYVSSGCTIWLAFFCVFLHCFWILILSSPLLGLGSKSTSLSPSFCVYRPRQYNTICWELDLIWEFSLFSWFFGQTESINVAGLLQ